MLLPRDTRHSLLDLHTKRGYEGKAHGPSKDLDEAMVDIPKQAFSFRILLIIKGKRRDTSWLGMGQLYLPVNHAHCQRGDRQGEVSV